MKRPCLGVGGKPCPLGALSERTRCDTCTKTYEQGRWAAKQGRYNGSWRKQSKRAIAAHIATHGPLCPGWGTGPHIVSPSTFVCDHDVGPLCRPCNSRKAATYDKARRSS